MAADFITRHLRPLRDARVVDYGNVNGYPTILFECPDGRHMQIEVAQDPENNGPGWIEMFDVSDANNPVAMIGGEPSPI